MVVSLYSNAQDEDTSPPVERQFTIDTPITIDLKEEEEEREGPKKKKRKKNVYWGLKTKKGFTKTGYGDNITLELFNYLKEYQEPDKYVQEIYWYDYKRRQIRRSKKVNKQYGVILHGPYQKKRKDQVLEEGVFYIGTKHGRWTVNSRNDILVDKKKYYKGWPRESLVTYYDENRTKLKEVIPVIFGEKEGFYYYFFENGSIAVKGHYSNDVKVGKWTAYYPFRSRRKREIIYPADPWNRVTKPHIFKEWSETGKVVYDYLVYLRKSS
jgi:antitoxin component YwqK of YwqJK toxin-antitoxin module